jgi:Carbohydrate-binding domain-containing protein Cthe_2159
MKRTTKVFLVIAVVLALSGFAAAMIATTSNVAAAIGQEMTSSSVLDTTSVESEGEYAEGVIEIVLGDTITISGEGATTDGNTVNITAAGVYSITGTLTDGQIDVNAKGKVYLEFDGVDITSSAGPALCITDAKKVTLTLVDGTTNLLTDAKCDNVNDAALFTNDTLIINGSGTLVVTGNNNEGISSDDDIIINSGTIKVTAVDDGLNAHDDITINDGDVYVVAGGDGLDSNGTVNINGGTLVSYGSTAIGDGGLDAIGIFTITGGTVIAGGNTVAAPGGDSSQCSIYVATGSVQAAGATIRVERDGEDILTITPDEEYQSLLISSDELVKDVTYQVYVGDTTSALSVTAATTPAGSGSMGAPAGEAGAGATTADQR